MNAPSTWPRVNAKREPIACYENARAALMLCELGFAFDKLADRPLVNGHPLREFSGDFSDKMASVLRQLVIERFGFDPGKSNVYDATIQLCLENSFNPVTDYLDALLWDGKPRLDTWLQQYAGAEDTEVNRAFGRAVLIAAVRRARQPGVKFDFILTLIGSQGCGKSSLIAALAGAPEHFSDSEIVQLSAKEQQEAIAGKWFIELSELAGFNKAGIDRIKSFASRTHDRARPAYGRLPEDRGRACIFIATTNEDAPLLDTTGNRRFWPVRVGRIKLPELKRDRDQLFAEACVREAEEDALGIPERLWDAATRVQLDYTEEDAWADALRKLRGSPENNTERLTRAQLAHFVADQMGIPIGKQDASVTKRLKSCLQLLGWTYKTVRINGVPQKGYERNLETSNG